MTPGRVSGSIFGVAFDVTVTPIAENEVQISGTAGGQPVEIRARADDEMLSVAGTLLGNDCSLTASDLP